MPHILQLFSQGSCAPPQPSDRQRGEVQDHQPDQIERLVSQSQEGGLLKGGADCLLLGSSLLNCMLTPASMNQLFNAVLAVLTKSAADIRLLKAHIKHSECVYH